MNCLNRCISIVLVTIFFAACGNEKGQVRHNGSSGAEDVATTAADPVVTPAPVIYDQDVWENLINFKMTALKDSGKTNAVREDWHWYYSTVFQNGAALKGPQHANKVLNDVYCKLSWKSKLLRSRKALAPAEVTRFATAATGESVFFSELEYLRATAEAKDGSRVREVECIKFSKKKITVGDLQRALGDYVRVEPK